MKLTFAIAFGLLLSASVLVHAQATSDQQTRSTEQELIALSTQWMEALERKDLPALERFLAEDYFISAPGEVEKTDRNEWLKNAVELDWTSLKYHNPRVNVYGDTAVVTALLDFKVTGSLGIPLSSDAQVTDIWVKRNGQWQVAARHLGAYSIGGLFRMALGFIAGLSLCFAIWLTLRLRKKFVTRN